MSSIANMGYLIISNGFKASWMGMNNKEVSMPCFHLRYFYSLVILAFVYCVIPTTLSANDMSLIESGQKLAERLCARCHAIGLVGDSPFKPAPPFRTFSKKWPIEHLEEALAEGIVVGHPDMPVFEFKPNQIGALIAYLNSLDSSKGK